ncbi:MAG: hypothetical protein AAGI71_00620 [Bacteroidota bacterium]
MLPALSETPFDAVDRTIAGWMHRNGLALLRISVGLVFVWFGALKLVGLSPAEGLVADTVSPFVNPDLFFPVLGVWEVVIGLLFWYRPALRIGILLLFLQMPGTMLPVILLPEQVFTVVPFGLTLEGQYIVKNVVLISAAIVVGGTVRYHDRIGTARDRRL